MSVRLKTISLDSAWLGLPSACHRMIAMTAPERSSGEKPVPLSVVQREEVGRLVEELIKSRGPFQDHMIVSR